MTPERIPQNSGHLGWLRAQAAKPRHRQGKRAAQTRPHRQGAYRQRTSTPCPCRNHPGDGTHEQAGMAQDIANQNVEWTKTPLSLRASSAMAVSRPGVLYQNDPALTLCRRRSCLPATFLPKHLSTKTNNPRGTTAARPKEMNHFGSLVDRASKGYVASAVASVDNASTRDPNSHSLSGCRHGGSRGSGAAGNVVAIH
jgi:hypothetical protein